MKDEERGGGVALAVSVVLVLIWVAAAGEEYADRPGKKLIEFGTVPRTAFLKERIREMEGDAFAGLDTGISEPCPFDGVVFGITGARDGKPVHAEYVFKRERNEREWFGEALAELEEVAFERFTDNFIRLESTPNETRWFSDADWETACQNLEIVLEAAKGCKARGILFDPEPYTASSMWNYTRLPNPEAEPYLACAAEARRRGRQFMSTIQSELPNAVFLSLFLLSGFRGMAREEHVSAALAGHPYGLLPPFLDGMLDAAGPEITFVDGNASSYYYQTEREFTDSFRFMKQEALRLVAPENRRKYLAQVQGGQAMFLDLVLGKWSASELLRNRGEDQKGNLVEKQAYLALANSDAFVWCFSPETHFFRDRNVHPFTVKALAEAKRRVNQPCLYFGGACAELPKLRLGAPAIDGDLSDTAWVEAMPLSDFVLQGDCWWRAPEAFTRTMAAYDDDRVYLAIDLEEPLVLDMREKGAESDDAVYAGDCVEVFINPAPMMPGGYRFVVDHRNLRYDARLPEPGRPWAGSPSYVSGAAWDGEWESAVRVGEDRWTVEIAIPWTTLGMPAPRPGQRLCANIGRRRWPIKEESAWSRTYASFCEAQNLGLWVIGP